MSTGRRHPKKIAGSSSYSFWVSTLGKLHQKDPEAKLFPGYYLSSKSGESIKGPDGVEYVVVSAETWKETQAPPKPAIASRGGMPYETERTPNDVTFQREKVDFLKRFGDGSNSVNNPPPTYVLGEGHASLLMDANDPEVFERGFMKGDLGTAFTQAVSGNNTKNQGPWSQVVSWYRKRIKELQEATPAMPIGYVKIDRSYYSIDKMKAILNVFGKGNVTFYSLSIPGSSKQNLAASDGHGHFILIADNEAYGIDGPELFPPEV